MNTELLFNVITWMGVPMWVIFILAPKSKATRYLVQSTWPWLVYGIVYSAIAASGMLTITDFDLAGFFTLEGVKYMYNYDLTGIASWVHILAWDLFLARWMLLDAPDAGYRLSPVLLLTYGFGPAGVMCFLLTRRGFLKGGHAQ